MFGDNNCIFSAGCIMNCLCSEWNEYVFYGGGAKFTLLSGLTGLLFCCLLGVRLTIFGWVQQTGPAARCDCEHGFPDGTEDQWGSLLREESFAPVLYCGQESLLFIPVQRLRPGDFPSLKNGGLCLFPPEVTWMENTNNFTFRVPSPLAPGCHFLSFSFGSLPR